MGYYSEEKSEVQKGFFFRRMVFKDESMNRIHPEARLNYGKFLKNFLLFFLLVLSLTACQSGSSSASPSMGDSEKSAVPTSEVASPEPELDSVENQPNQVDDEVVAPTSQASEFEDGELSKDTHEILGDVNSLTVTMTNSAGTTFHLNFITNTSLFKSATMDAEKLMKYIENFIPNGEISQVGEGDTIKIYMLDYQGLDESGTTAKFLEEEGKVLFGGANYREEYDYRYYNRTMSTSEFVIVFNFDRPKSFSEEKGFDLAVILDDIISEHLAGVLLAGEVQLGNSDIDPQFIAALDDGKVDVYTGVINNIDSPSGIVDIELP